jgi:hypothetical protein
VATQPHLDSATRSPQNPLRRPLPRLTSTTSRPGLTHRRSDSLWLREAKRRLEEQRAKEARPVPGSRPKRLEEAKRRLDEELWSELRANRAYEHYGTGRMKDGRRFGRPPDPDTPPAIPPGQINLTDPDWRVVKGSRGRGFLQGDDAQAVANEHQIVLAAEVMTVAPDFGHLEPMLDAAQRELAAAGVSDVSRVLLGDAGYWHQQQMERILDRGRYCSRPTPRAAKAPAQAGTAASTRSCAECSPPTVAASSTANAKRSSSRASRTRSSTAASTASDAAAEPPSAPNGALTTATHNLRG